MIGNYDPNSKNSFNNFISKLPFIGGYKKNRKSKIACSNPDSLNDRSESKTPDLTPFKTKDQPKLKRFLSTFKLKTKANTPTTSPKIEVHTISSNLPNPSAKEKLEDCLSVKSCLEFVDNCLNSSYSSSSSSKNCSSLCGSCDNSMPSNINKFVIYKRPSDQNNRIMMTSNPLPTVCVFNNEYSEPFDVIRNVKSKNITDQKLQAACKSSQSSSYSSSSSSDSAYSSDHYKSLIQSCEKIKDEAALSSSSYSSTASSSASTSPKQNLLLSKNDSPLIKADKELYKSAITAFDVLTERCSNLLNLFKDKNTPTTPSPPQQSKTTKSSNSLNNNSEIEEEEIYTELLSSTDQNSTSTSSNFKYTKNTRIVLNKSAFLERTLNFDSYMKCCTLLLSKSKHINNTTFSSSCSSCSSSSSINSIINESFSSVNGGSSASSINNLNSMRNFILKLAKKDDNLFGKSINQFISCTKSTKEANPLVLMRNTRQFMNGIKNYLLKNENATPPSFKAQNIDQFKVLLDNHRSNHLGPSEVLNIDSIIEDCLQSIVLSPLKFKINQLLMNSYIADGSLLTLNKNMKKILEFIFKDGEQLQPGKHVFLTVKSYFNCMQCEYAPLIKLKYILFIINELLNSRPEFQCGLYDLNELNLSEFLFYLVYTLCKCKIYTIQIELDYIWNLVNKSLINQETVFYLTLLNSACNIIQFFSTNIANNTSRFLSPGLIDVYACDNRCQRLIKKQIPLRTDSKCKELNSLIAFLFRVYSSDSSSFSLYTIENGIEKNLKDDDCPFELRQDRLKRGFAIDNMRYVYKQKNFNLVLPNFS